MVDKKNNELEIDNPLTRRDFENYMGKFIAKLVFGSLVLMVGFIIMYFSLVTIEGIPDEIISTYPGLSLISICSLIFGLLIAVLGVIIVISGIQPTADKNKNRIKKENGSI